MTLRLVLLALLTLAATPGRAADRIERRHLGAWTLEARTDAFTGARSCRLSASHMDYRRGAVVLRLPRWEDTSAAVYRVDAGPPVDTRAEAMEMARRGFALNDDTLTNPSGGLVRIPEEQLASAKIVWVRADAKSRPEVFKIAGLSAALDAAHAAGCPPDAFDPPR